MRRRAPLRARRSRRAPASERATSREARPRAKPPPPSGAAAAARDASAACLLDGSAAVISLDPAIEGRPRCSRRVRRVRKRRDERARAPRLSARSSARARRRRARRCVVRVGCGSRRPVAPPSRCRRRGATRTTAARPRRLATEAELADAREALAGASGRPRGDAARPSSRACGVLALIRPVVHLRARARRAARAHADLARVARARWCAGDDERRSRRPVRATSSPGLRRAALAHPRLRARRARRAALADRRITRRRPATQRRAPRARARRNAGRRPRARRAPCARTAGRLRRPLEPRRRFRARVSRRGADAPCTARADNCGGIRSDRRGRGAAEARSRAAARGAARPPRRRPRAAPRSLALSLARRPRASRPARRVALVATARATARAAPRVCPLPRRSGAEGRAVALPRRARRDKLNGCSRKARPTDGEYANAPRRVRRGGAAPPRASRAHRGLRARLATSCSWRGANRGAGRARRRRARADARGRASSPRAPSEAAGVASASRSDVARGARPRRGMSGAAQPRARPGARARARAAAAGGDARGRAARRAARHVERRARGGAAGESSATRWRRRPRSTRRARARGGRARARGGDARGLRSCGAARVARALRRPARSTARRSSMTARRRARRLPRAAADRRARARDAASRAGRRAPQRATELARAQPLRAATARVRAFAVASAAGSLGSLRPRAPRRARRRARARARRSVGRRRRRVAVASAVAAFLRSARRHAARASVASPTREAFGRPRCDVPPTRANAAEDLGLARAAAARRSRAAGIVRTASRRAFARERARAFGGARARARARVREPWRRTARPPPTPPHRSAAFAADRRLVAPDARFAARACEASVGGASVPGFGARASARREAPPRSRRAEVRDACSSAAPPAALAPPQLSRLRASLDAREFARSRRRERRARRAVAAAFDGAARRGVGGVSERLRTLACRFAAPRRRAGSSAPCADAAPSTRARQRRPVPPTSASGSPQRLRGGAAERAPARQRRVAARGRRHRTRRPRPSARWKRASAARARPRALGVPPRRKLSRDRSGVGAASGARAAPRRARVALDRRARAAARAQRRRLLRVPRRRPAPARAAPQRRSTGATARAPLFRPRAPPAARACSRPEALAGRARAAPRARGRCAIEPHSFLDGRQATIGRGRRQRAFDLRLAPRARRASRDGAQRAPVRTRAPDRGRLLRERGGRVRGERGRHAPRSPKTRARRGARRGSTRPGTLAGRARAPAPPLAGREILAPLRTQATAKSSARIGAARRPCDRARRRRARVAVAHARPPSALSSLPPTSAERSGRA